MTEDVEAQTAPIAEEEKALTDEKQVEIRKSSIEKEKPSERKGLSKEELMQYANDPFWIKMRMSLFVLFWLAWLGMLAASVVIIIYAPKCPSPDPKEWWQKGPIYKTDKSDYTDLYTEETPSFFTNLIEDLDYIVEAGFNTLYIGNIFKVSDDEGSVVDFLDVDPNLGTLDEWNSLVAELEQRNIKVIVDFTPDSTSVHHEWYETAFDGFYSDGTTLDISNSKVVENLQAVISTWTGRGVSGFNIKSPKIIDGVINDNQEAKSLIVSLRETLDAAVPESSRILAAFTDLDLKQLAPLYGNDVQANHVGSMFHLATGKSMVESLPELTAAHIFDYVNTVQNSLSNNSWPGVVISSSNARVADTNADMVDGVNMLATMLKATPIVKAGDELGFKSGEDDWSFRSVQSQEFKAGENTHWGVFSQLAELRHSDTILFGDLFNNQFDDCSVITRLKRGNPGYAMVINTGNQETKLDISSIQGMGETIRLKASSVLASPPTNATLEVKAFPSSEVVIGAREAKLFTFVPNLEI